MARAVRDGNSQGLASLDLGHWEVADSISCYQKRAQNRRLPCKRKSNQTVTSDLASIHVASSVSLC